MGRWSYSDKTEADGLKNLSVYWLKKQGYFQPDSWKTGLVTWTNSWSNHKSSVGIEVSTHQDLYIRFTYTQTDQDGKKEDFDYRFPITTTNCFFGGVRYWFTCSLFTNGVFCGRRVGTLYLAGKYFGCRNCYDLTYSSKKENRHSKAYACFKALTYFDDISKLEDQIKRRFYRGKPTKKQRRLERLERMASFYGRPLIDENLYLKKKSR